MLSDQVKQLLTAFVDGELSQRQRKAVMRLLHRSSEARAMLRQLQENAHKLKQLPRHKVEPSLVDEIMQAIAEQQAQPKQSATKAGRRRWLPYLAASMAASLLIGALSLAYWMAMADREDAPKKDTNLADVNNPEKKPNPQPAPPTPPAPRKPNPMLAQLVEGTFRAASNPVPDDPALTAKFSEFQNDGVKSGELARELNRDQAVQLDITVKNNPMAMERLKSALHAFKVEVLEDPNAAKALKEKDPKKQAKVEYWVYAENLTTDELAKMMKELSLNDTTGKGTSVASPYDHVTVKPITANENKKIAGLLGIDANKLAMPKNDKNTKPEPIEDWQRKVVVLPFNAGAQPSDEVSQFVNQRRRPQAGAVRVLIKIHE